MGWSLPGRRDVPATLAAIREPRIRRVSPQTTITATPPSQPIPTYPPIIMSLAPTVAPYGTWSSPISADLIVAKTIAFAGTSASEEYLVCGGRFVQ